eukprot:4728415-Prymnesium_polylepis.1
MVPLEVQPAHHKESAAQAQVDGRIRGPGIRGPRAGGRRDGRHRRRGRAHPGARGTHARADRKGEGGDGAA